MIPLTDAGALVDVHTNWTQTPEIHAATYTEDVIGAEILLDAGACIDWRDQDGITALSWTAIADSVVIAKVSFRRGANTTNFDLSGDTILSLAVASNRVKSLRLLAGRIVIPRGAREPLEATKNVLLIAAEYVSLNTINDLSHLSIQGLNTSATNRHGKTSRCLLKARADFNADLTHAMNRPIYMLHSINRELTETNAGDAGKDLSFEKALEYQNS